LRLRGEDAGHEVGNPLLAAWAGPTREYFSALINVFGDSQEDSGDDYVEPTAHTRLHRLQNSILHLEDLPPGSLVTEDPDRSVEIHVCHSMARQLEVVTDRLLSLFSAKDDASEAIRPSDVLIAVPDLEAAAPLVDAVFAALPDHRRIPYTITGRARTQTDTVARTVCDLLTVAASRLEADAVWALLDRPMVARRFGLDADRLEPMRDWIAASGFRWGLDDRHCARLQTRVSRRHTLDAGMDRLFLAYALPAGHMSPLWDELLPAPGVHDRRLRQLELRFRPPAQRGATPRGQRLPAHRPSRGRLGTAHSTLDVRVYTEGRRLASVIANDYHLHTHPRSVAPCGSPSLPSPCPPHRPPPSCT